MKLYDLFEISAKPQYVDDYVDGMDSMIEVSPWHSMAVKIYDSKGLDALFKYIADTKKQDIPSVKMDFESDRADFNSEREAVGEFLRLIDDIPESKDKPKQNNPVAKHSRNMPGAGAHKSPKDYDRKDAKKDIKKQLDEELPDMSDEMVGAPDSYYDAEDRTEAYNDLQDALQGNYMDDYIIDGSCPACGGNGYQDGEEEMWDDDEDDYVEGNECDGFGNYGCDQGEMTFGSDEPNWVEIIKHDKRQATKKDQEANRPSDEELIPKLANMMKNMDDPRMAVRQVRIDYGYGPAKASDLVGKAFQLLKQDEGLQFDEGTRCWKGYKKKGMKTMFGKRVPNCVKNEAIDKDIPCPACGDPKCDHKEDHIDDFRKEFMKEGEERSIIQNACIEKLVDEFGGRENQFQNKDDLEYAIYQRLEDLDVDDCVDPDMEVGGQRIGDFASGKVIDVCSSSSIIYDVMANMDETQIGEGKSPHKKGTAKYKKHMAAMHAEDVNTDSSEADVSKMLAKALGDPNRWQEMSAPELYAELESRDTDFADAIKQVAKIVYGVKLEETITTISK